MSGLIDTAYVEIESRSEKFEAGATKSFDDIEKVGQSVANAVERAFDEMSRELVQQFEHMRREADMNMDALITKVDEVGRDINHEINQGTNAAERGFDELRRAADRDLDQVERKASHVGASVRGHFGGMGAGIAVGGAAAAGIGIAAAGLGALTAFGLQSAASLEQVQIQFNALTGSAEQGQKVFKDLQQFAATTPFEFPDVAHAAARFLAFNQAVGMSDGELQSFLTTTGNVISVTGGGADALNSVTLAMGQIASSGKITLDNLNQISEAMPGFSAPAAIAAATGKTTAQVMDDISKGSIDATTGIHALLQGMQQFPGAAGAMEAQSQTLMGVFSTFKDTVGQALAGAFAPAIPAIKDTLTQLTPIIGDALGVLAPALGGALAAIMPLIADLVKGLVPVLGPIVKALGEGLSAARPAITAIAGALGPLASALAPIIVLAGQIIGTLGTALAPILLLIANSIASVVTPIIGALGQVFVALAPSIVQLATVFASQLAPLFAQLGPLAVQFANALIPMIPDLMELVQAMLEAVVAGKPILDLLVQLIPVMMTFPDFGSGIVKFLINLATELIRLPQTIAGVIDAIISWGASVGSAIGGFIDTVLNFFAGLPGQIMSFLSSLPGMIIDLATSAFTGFFYAVGYGIGLIIGEIAALPGQIAAYFTFMWDMARTLTVNGILGVINFVTQLPGRLANIISSAWNWVVSLFRSGSDNAVSTTSSMIDRVISFVTGLPGRIGSALGDAGSWLVNTGHDIIAGLIHGIENAIGWAVDVVKNAMGSILKGAKDAIIARSPSRKYADEVGKWIPHGVAVGVTEHADVAVNAISNMLNPVTGGQLGTVGGGVTLGAGAIVINMSGDVTQQQAYDSGAQAGQGLMDVLLAQGRALAQRPRTV